MTALPPSSAGPPYPNVVTPPTFNYWQTILSQYANSPVLTDMIGSMNAALDPTQFFNDLYNDIWNVNTAQGYGLDVWGRIVGVTRNLNIPSPVTGTFFGFEEAGSWLGFGQAGGGFFAGSTGSGAQLTTSFTLQDPDFRTLIFAKAGANISNGSIPAINNLLMNLFPGRGTVYVQDNQNMTLTYVSLFPLTTIELVILQQSNVLPNPTGVVVNFLQIPPIPNVEDHTLLRRRAIRHNTQFSQLESLREGTGG
jgi:hypothetical protein